MDGLRGQEIIEFFDADWDDEYNRMCVSRAVAAYEKAEDICRSNLTDNAAHGAVGHLKRAILQDMLAFAAPQRGINATWEKNKNRSDDHVELARGRVRLTISAVEHPSITPQDALFRHTLAKDSQAAFIGEGWPVHERPIPNGTPLFGIITHGRLDGDDIYGLPGFLNISFPNDECTKYLAIISLFKRYPDLPEVKRIEEVRREIAFRRLQQKTNRRGG